MSEPEEPPVKSADAEKGDTTRDGLVYLVAQEQAQANVSDGISFLSLLRVFWKDKWLIAAIIAVFACVSVVYSLTATPWYRSEMLLARSDEKAMQGVGGVLGGLGGIASLAGISVGGGGNAEPIAIVRSRDFVRKFIEDRGLLTVLLHERWNEEEARWNSADPEDWPDVRDAVEFFLESVLRVFENPETGLVTIAIDWTDPEIAADWAKDLVTLLNADMRRRALLEADTNVTFLEEELAATNVATLRQSIGTLLETELQKLMLARGNEEFAFRVIDGAQIPKKPERPNRGLIVLLALVLGSIAGVALAILRYIVAIDRLQEQGHDG